MSFQSKFFVAEQKTKAKFSPNLNSQFDTRNIALFCPKLWAIGDEIKADTAGRTGEKEEAETVTRRERETERSGKERREEQNTKFLLVILGKRNRSNEGRENKFSYLRCV